MGLDLYDRENMRAREELAKGVKDQAAAYRERTEQERKQAHADRLADVRMRAVEQAFRMLELGEGTHTMADVFALADQIVEYTRKGA